MRNVVLKGLRAHKRRVASTLLSVFFGVAFLVGVQVLGDSVSQQFVSLFTDVFSGTDAQVRSSQEVKTQGNTLRGRIDDDLVDTVRAVPGVKTAEIGVFGFGALFGKDGKPIGNTMGPPTFASNWTDTPGLSRFKLVEGGKSPQVVAEGQPVEVVVDKHTADEGDLAVGDVIKIQVSAAQTPVKVVGIAKFGKADSPGGAAFTLFHITDAQRLVAEPGKADYISVVGDDSLSQEELSQRIGAQLPSGVESVTGDTVKDENINDINQVVSIFKTFLSVFAGISIAVGGFSIFNTFSIIVAQRTREMALLRCLGARRGQVLTAVLGEALIVGILGFVFGLLGGLATAQVLIGALDAAGFEVPAGDLILRPIVVVEAFLVGVGLTMLSAAAPAIRASRVSPLAAMRDAATDSVTVPKLRLVVGSALGVLGAIGIVYCGIVDIDNFAIYAALSALVCIAGIIVLGPVVAGTAAKVLGGVAVALKGVTGTIARDNVLRSPKRAARTATMLMIGVTVVTLFTVLGASINKAVEEQVNEAFVGDLVVSSGGGGFGGFDAGLTQRLREVPQVEQVTPLRFGPASIDGEGAQAAVVDPATLGSGLKLSVVEGNLADLSGETIAVSKQQAEDENLRLGDRLPITFLDGQSVDLPISAIFEAQGVLNGVNFALSTNTFDPHATDKLDSSVFVSFKDDVSTADGREAIKPITDDYSQATVQDRKEFRESVQSQINTFLALIYVLLALSIFISLLGIANTLSLSIHERTRELGLLRAVGMSRKQLRSAVRWESIILAVFGTIGGLALGVFISWAFVKPAERENFASLTLPTGSLAIILFVGALAGLVAAISPARRAAKLNVLDAIATE